MEPLVEGTTAVVRVALRGREATSSGSLVCGPPRRFRPAECPACKASVCGGAHGTAAASSCALAAIASVFPAAAATFARARILSCAGRQCLPGIAKWQAETEPSRSARQGSRRMRTREWEARAVGHKGQELAKPYQDNPSPGTTAEHLTLVPHGLYAIIP